MICTQHRPTSKSTARSISPQERGPSCPRTDSSSHGDQPPTAPSVSPQAASKVTPDTHPSGESSWMGQMLSLGTLPARVTAAPLVRGWRGASGTRGDGGYHSFGKIPVCTTDPHSTYCPACFWASGYFWPCWQLFLFIQCLWVAILALTFRVNWPSSLKDTEQNKERLRYKYTEIGHASLSGEPLISPVIILPGGSMRL